MATLDQLTAFVADKTEVAADDCARHLGIALNNANRTMIGDALRQAGWRKYRVRRNGILYSAFQRAPAIDPELSRREKELRKFLRTVENVTADECCWALHVIPGPEIRQEVVAHLKRWRWVRVTPIVRGRIEWRRRQGLRLVPEEADS